MAITFTCPNPICKSSMTVPDALAGKQGKCSKCKGPVTVPKPAANGVPTPPPAPVPVTTAVLADPPIDLEAEAMAVLADAPTEVEKEADFVEFNCPQCDEPLKLPLAMAGKRHPCPECRRIIPVPYPKKKDKANWRDTGPKLPTGAKRDDGPAPDGAWGTAAKTGVSREALEEAGVIKEKEKPLTLYQRFQPHLLIGTPIVLLLAGGLFAWTWLARVTEAGALNAALTAARDASAPKVIGTEGLLPLHGYAGVYYLTSQKPDCAARAFEHFQKAAALGKETGSPSSDALLADLAVAELDLAGTKAETDGGRKKEWPEVQKLVRSTLDGIDSREARLAAVSRIVAGLVERGQVARVGPLVGEVAAYSAPGADRAEALATAGLELDRLGKKDEATALLTEALKPYTDKKQASPPVRPAVVSLALLLGKPPPAAAKNFEEEESVSIGKADALARQGKLDEARKAAREPGSKDGQLRGMVAVAAAAAETKQGTDDVQPALDAAKAIGPRAELGWPLLRLVQVGLQAGLPADQLEPALASMENTDQRAWGKLLLLRAKLQASRAVEPADAAEALPAASLAGAVARLELARHNTRLDRGWAGKVKAWDDGPRAVGSIGVALGMQGGKP